MNWAPKYPIFEFLPTIRNNCSDLQDSQLQAGTKRLTVLNRLTPLFRTPAAIKL